MNGSAAVTDPQLDRDNPWPGLESFEEQARDYFHGRETETEELLRRVADAPLTVLFGKSGLGKTSLLKAGLFPRLRERHFLPVHVRLDIRPEAPELIEQLRDGLREAIERERVDAPAFATGETLWEYLHRADPELWSEQNYPLAPVLVLDQLEEGFTLGERLPERMERFKIDLGDLAENRIPEALAGRLAADVSAAQRLDLRRMGYKLIVALREDFLPHLEGWRAAVPALGRVRLRLLPMRPEQALSAVYETAPHLMDEPLARRIVAFVAAAQETSAGDGSGEIEPALLSLFCRGLNERRKRQGKDRFDDQLLEGAQQSIIADYYRSCLEGLPDSASRFIETGLITEKGFRNSYAKDDAVPSLLTQEQLDRLINRRLLRLEERYGTARIELTHDLLTRAVMAHRDRRRLEEERLALRAQARRQRRRVLALALVALVCLALAGLAAWQWRAAVTAKTIAEGAKQKAQQEEGKAIKAAQLAETSATGELVARKRAEENQRQAVEAQRSSLSAKLASDARAERERGLDLSFLLGSASWSVKPTLEARNVLLSSLLEQPALRGILPSRSAVSAAVFSPDGKTLAATNGDNTIVLWDVARHVPLGRPFVGHTESVLSIAFSPDGKILASGGWDKTVILWDVNRRAPLGPPLAGHTDRIRSVAFSPDGKTLASASDDKTVILWNVGNRKPLGDPLAGHTLAATSVAFSPDGKAFASGSADGTIIVKDVIDVFGLSLFSGHKESVRSIAFSPDGKTLASGSEDGTVILWDVASHKPRAEPLTGHKGWVFSVTFSPDGKTLAAGTDGKATMLWDVAGRTALGEPLAGPGGSALSVAFSPDGKALATGTRDKGVLFWDVAHRKPLGKALTGEGAIAAAAFSPDGKILAAGSDKSVLLWDIARRRPLGEPLAGHKRVINSVAFSPDGRTLASGSSDATVILWDIASRKPIGKPLAGHKDLIWSVAFSPDGGVLASGSEDGTILLWDVARRASLGKPLAGSGGWVLSLAFSPDGRILAAGHADGSVNLWDVVRRSSRDLPAGHEEEVRSVSFSPDGKTLAAGSIDGTVLLWDVARRTRIGGPLVGTKDRSQSVAFSPDGKTLAAASRDGRVILWDVDPDSWSRRACLIASRNLTCDEWHRYLLGEPYKKICPGLPGPERCDAD